MGRYIGQQVSTTLVRIKRRKRKRRRRTPLLLRMVDFLMNKSYERGKFNLKMQIGKTAVSVPVEEGQCFELKIHQRGIQLTRNQEIIAQFQDREDQ